MKLERCGLTQDGIHLRAGIEYKFRIFCGTAEGRLSNAEISGFGITLRPAIENGRIKLPPLSVICVV